MYSARREQRAKEKLRKLRQKAVTATKSAKKASKESEQLSLNAVIILHTWLATRYHFQLRRTKIISVAFGCIFAKQVAEAADSSLFLFKDYLLQLFKTKRTADWNNKGCSGSITRFMVSFQYGTVVNAVCALWQASKTVPTDSLALSRSKILKTTTDSDSSARLTA